MADKKWVDPYAIGVGGTSKTMEPKAASPKSMSPASPKKWVDPYAISQEQPEKEKPTVNPADTSWMGQNRYKIAEDIAAGKGTWGEGLPEAASKVGDFFWNLSKGLPNPVRAGIGATFETGTNLLPMLLNYNFGGDAAKEAVMLGKQSKSMMQRAVMPGQKDLVTGDATRAMGTMLKERLYPTPNSMKEAFVRAMSEDRRVAEMLEKSKATGKLSEVTDEIAKLMAKKEWTANPNAKLADLEDIWTKFLQESIVGQYSKNVSKNVPVSMLHKTKQATYADLGENAFAQRSVEQASKEAGLKSLAQGLRKATIENAPEIAPHLQRESDLLNVVNAVEGRAHVLGNRHPIGLGALVAGSDPRSAMLFAADRSALLKAWVAQQMYHGSKASVLSPLIMSELTKPDPVGVLNTAGQVPQGILSYIYPDRFQ